ncbi:MAG: PAS domain S-box protein [Acidobacteria bacterium]|nr:PAS domain S-box protein [Acidobacteriota bacterium]
MIAIILLVVIGVIEQGNVSRPFVPILFAVASTVLGLSILYYFTLKSRLPLVFQCYAQLSLDLGIVTWLVYSTGDIESPFLALYLVIIFAASTLFGRRGVLLIGASSGTLYGLTGLLILVAAISRASGWPANTESSIKWVEFMFSLNLIAIFFVTILSGHLAERARLSETELATATKDLAEYRLFNDRIIESVRSGLITTDLRGDIITYNRAAEEITGYKANEVRGRNIYAIFGDIGQQIEVGLESIRSRARLPRFDIDCRTAEGAPIHLGFSVAPLVDDAEAERGYVLTFQDLTEVMELEREVRRQERLAALGKMAAGLAHEIRNPLASMRGSVQVLASELNLSPEQRQLMNIVLRESERLNRIVSDFLTYARPPKTDFSQIELSSILAEAVALLRNSPELGPKHLLTEQYPCEPVFYLGDANQLKQIFWNLSRNAVQAMPHGGELKVALETPANGDVMISFTDTGQGMSAEQKERLFEPFNSSSGGTGLGMAIVYQLVHDHNGKILVDSEMGEGTTIAIKLPADGLVSPDPQTSPTANLLAENPQTPALAGTVN